jgi:hypothetical protein
METIREERQYPRKARRSPWPQIDVAKWQVEVLRTEAEIKALKKAMRASGHNISCKEAYELMRLKGVATKLYQIRAASHGRIHLRTEALKMQKDEIEDQFKEYARAA